MRPVEHIRTSWLSSFYIKGFNLDGWLLFRAALVFVNVKQYPISNKKERLLLAKLRPPCEQSLLLLSFWVRRRKGGSTWIASNLWSHRSSNFWANQSFVKQVYSSASTRYFLNRCSQPSPLINLVLSRQTGFFECEHPFIDKPIVWLTKPAEATCRAYSTKILLHSWGVFLQDAKIKQARERLCRMS